jgi:hypothetical protein
MSTAYTHVLYQNRALEFLVDDNNHRMVAQKPLREGTLLLLEHVVEGERGTLANLVAADRALYDSLHPRHVSPDILGRMKGWDESARHDEEGHMATLKVVGNAFGVGIAESARCRLGHMLSKFNHSCLPNAIAWGMPQQICPQYTAAPIAVILLRDVKKGEEITVRYTVHAGHEEEDGVDDTDDGPYSMHSWVCDCGLSLEARLGMNNNDIDHASQLSREPVVRSVAGTLFDRYFQGDNRPFMLVAMHHMCAERGLLYMPADGSMAVTPKFLRSVGLKPNKRRNKEKHVRRHIVRVGLEVEEMLLAGIP